MLVHVMFIVAVIYQLIALHFVCPAKKEKNELCTNDLREPGVYVDFSVDIPTCIAIVIHQGKREYSANQLRPSNECESTETRQKKWGLDDCICMKMR